MTKAEINFLREGVQKQIDDGVAKLVKQLGKNHPATRRFITAVGKVEELLDTQGHLEPEEFKQRVDAIMKGF